MSVQQVHPTHECRRRASPLHNADLAHLEPLDPRATTKSPRGCCCGRRPDLGRCKAAGTARALPRLCARLTSGAAGAPRSSTCTPCARGEPRAIPNISTSKNLAPQSRRAATSHAKAAATGIVPVPCLCSPATDLAHCRRVQIPSALRRGFLSVPKRASVEDFVVGRLLPLPMGTSSKNVFRTNKRPTEHQSSPRPKYAPQSPSP